MNSRRVAEVHKKGTKLLAKVEVTPVSKVQMRRLEHPSYGFHWFDPSVPPSSDSLYIELEGKLYYCDLGETAYSVVIDGTIEEVVDACSRYLGILQKLLEDFEGSLC